MTHAGIDGYTRMIVYLHCSTNNKATTVYELFLSSVRQFGVPSRVRSDQGGENVLVAQFMLEYRGSERRSMITGSSTHHQRIERLWRDVQRCVGELYYRLFYHMENLDLLDPTNEIHIYSLHLVYLHRINTSLKGFKEAWNYHKIRTEHNRTPHQLFTEGVLRLHSSGLVALDFLEEVDDEYGAHGAENAIVIPDDYEGVQIPENRFSLNEEHAELLQQNVDFSAQSQNYAIDIYSSV